ncbi:unnamed protein product, partial [Ectocarpus sp. 8 AP-2014]
GSATRSWRGWWRRFGRPSCARRSCQARGRTSRGQARVNDLRPTPSGVVASSSKNTLRRTELPQGFRRVSKVPRQRVEAGVPAGWVGTRS